MSIDAGGLAQMTYNSNGNPFPASNGIGLPTAGFGARGTRLNPKRLSVALPPKVAPISEHGVEAPTPRTSRSHLLAGLRTQPKTPAVPASAPYHQTQHQIPGLGASRWAEQPSYLASYNQGVPQTAIGSSFDLPNQYATAAGRQMYSLPEQVLAPPTVYDQAEEMDPNVLQQMQLHSQFLFQRQQQLQQQLAMVTAAAQNMSLNGNVNRASFMQQAPLNLYAQQQQQQQQQIQAPIEVPGQPGVYLVYNPAVQGYTYAVDQNVQQLQMQQAQAHQVAFQAQSYEGAHAAHSITPPSTERSTPSNLRSFTPPKKAPSPPSTLEHVQPLPPPSATAFRRGHKKASSLAIQAINNISDGPKTSALAFGSSRSVFPPTPMTGTFGPGAARAGEHPTRQPHGPPPLEELTAAPTTKHEGSKNFAARQRRRALDSLMRAGIQRREVSRSSGGSPVSERDYPFSSEDIAAANGTACRKMSPIGSEMKEKRGSQGSSDGYFGLSSASSSEAEESGAYKQPHTPANVAAPVGERKKMMLGVLNAAEKRKSYAS